MPTYANPLYANGVPTYTNEVGALGEVFKALAPNPLRDLQIQGYANNSRLSKLRGDVIENQQSGLGTAADMFMKGDVHGAYGGLIRSGNSKVLTAMPGTVLGDYSARALQDPTLVNPDVQATLSVGAGHDYKTTVPGFTANQDRLTEEANQKNDTAIYGIDTRSADSRYGTDVGATTARRGQDIGEGNATYNTNMRALYGGTGRGGFGGSGSSTGKPPAAPQMNAATAKGVSSVFADSMPEGLPPEAQDDIKARTVYYVNNGPAETRNNPRAAFLRARQDVAGGNQPTRDTLPLYGEYGSATTQPVAVDQRPPLPEPVANIYGGPATSVSNMAGGGGGAGGLSPLGQTILQGDPNINLRKPLSAGQLRPAAPAAAPAAAPPAAAPSGGMITARTPADIAGLPSGTPFKTPDGRVKYVP